MEAFGTWSWPNPDPICNCASDTAVNSCFDVLDSDTSIWSSGARFGDDSMAIELVNIEEGDRADIGELYVDCDEDDAHR